MSETPNESQVPHHRSARERQRKGPMWGCLKTLTLAFAGLGLLLALIIGGGWFYVGSTSFASLVRLRVERTLEARLGRQVTIGSVSINRSRPQRVILNDIRIANAPGGVHPWFATVRQVEIAGGIDSFWGRRIRVGRIDIRDPRVYFEVFPAGAPLQHNFPRWQSGRRGRYEIYRLDVGTLFVSGGEFDFLDRRRDIAAVVKDLGAQVNVTLARGVYEGTATSSAVRVRIQDYVPFDLDLRGGFRYADGGLMLHSIALRGRDMEMFLSGRVAPLADAVYDLRLRSRLGLNRVREIFKVEKTLEGMLSLDTRLRGQSGNFRLAGGWVSDRIRADVYELTTLEGKLVVTDQQVVVDVIRGDYAGGRVTAHYVLPKYDEPYPMSIDLGYERVSLEKLFTDWGVRDTGLRGAATGRLSYGWNKDLVLEGSGEGTARLEKTTQVFSNARYAIPLAGSADFALDRGVIRFRRGTLTTDASQIDFSGSLRIEDVGTDLSIAIRSTDFAELDRAATNFALSADKKDYEPLGLGGSGEIRGTVRGPIRTPQVAAHVFSTGTKYNDAPLGAAEIDLAYDGVKSVLTFERAVFTDDGGRLTLTGTIAFPDRGPSPVFDLAIDADRYSVEKALAVVDLPLAGIRGVGTGRLVITGSPENGTARFAGLTIAQPGAALTLRGDVNWLPGEGNVRFDLDLAARDFPVKDVAEFLEFGDLPVSGRLTGELHIEGPKKELEGSGSVLVKQGVIMGEPVESASATLEFTRGRMRARDVRVTAPAGEIRGEASLDLATGEFSYKLDSASIDLSRLELLKDLAGLLGGRLVLTTSGSGTLEQPAIVLQATLSEATIRGLALPAGSPPPSIYFEMRGGQLTIRGDLAGLVSIEGSGTFTEDLSVDGLVSVRVPDMARLAGVFPNTATLGVSGKMAMELRLGGKLSSIEALRIDGSFPEFAIRLSEHQFTSDRPLRFSLRDGALRLDDFQLTHPEAALRIAGSVSFVGQKRIDLSINGGLEAALLQLLVAGLRSEGRIDVAAGITGTLASPRVNGTVEVLGAQFRFPGFPQILDEVTGTLVFNGDRVDIDSLSASLGGGTVIVGGWMEVDGLTPRRLRVTLQGTDVSLRYFEGLTIAGDFAAVLTGAMDRLTLQGEVGVDRGLYFRDFDFTTALLNVVLSRRGVTPVVAASWQDRVDLQLKITAEDTLAVRNNVADVTGSAELEVNGTLANPVVLGLVSLDEGGRVRLQGVDYRVVRGSINFQNPFRIDPYFDVTLEGRVAGTGFTSELESGPVDVTINLTGTIDRFTPTVTSDPPASDITLFSILGFGALANDTGAGPSGGVGTVGASLLTQGLAGFLGNRILPFADTFTFDPGLIDSSTDPGQKVMIEKRVSNSVRVVVIYNLTQGRSRALVEWQVTPDWTLQLTNDEVRHERRVEARFRRRYAAHWTWGGRGEPVTLVASRGQVATDAPPALAAPADGMPPPPSGPNVTAVNYRADAPFDTSALEQYVSVRAGEPLSIRAVQSSIKSLFATGNFRDVRVETQAGPGGLSVTFVLSLTYRVATIRFEGLTEADRARAERDVSVRVGDVLSLNAVDRSAVMIQDFLSRSGYLEATVDPETQFERARSRADLIFHVSTGPRARVGDVVLEGNFAPISVGELISQMRNGPGTDFTSAGARSDAERMERLMIRRDYRKADVRFASSTYDKATRTVTLRYTGSAGPIVRVEVQGVPRREVRRLIPFARNQAYSEDVIDTAADAIVRHYQERGHFNAVVDTESRLEDNVWTTTFHIAPGRRFRLAGVTFTGNEKVSDETLRPVVQTAPGGGFGSLLARIFRRPTGVTRTQLSADRDAVESHYRLAGFSEATVEDPEVTTNEATGTMTVEFPIREGPQTIVRTATVEGNEQVGEEELPELMLRPGAPLNPQLLRTDVVNLQAFYADRGNAEVQIAPRAEISPDRTAAGITYVITEGPRIRLGDVVVRGNTYTDHDVVLRKSELEKGDPFSYTSILEAQRNLYRLGIFQRVDIQPEQAGTSVADRNVVIQVEEGKDLTIAGSLGATKQSGVDYSPLGSVSVAHRNLFGTGRYAGLQLIGSRERREAFLTYREPFLGKWNIPVQFTAFQSDERRPRAHIVQRGASVELSRAARLQTRWSLRYEYRIADCQVENIGDLCWQAEQSIVPGLDRTITDISISSITPTFFWDRRDDPIDPRRGFFTTALVEYASPIGAAEAHFLKEYAQGSYYIPLSGRTTMALSGRVGFIQPLGSVNDASGRRIRRPVPYTERFTGGGANSHRGYALDLLGTLCTPTAEGCDGTLLFLRDPDTGAVSDVLAPIGGNSTLIANIEYRFPIFSSVGGAVFTDVGNVFPTAVIRFNELRYGVGAGLRYLSPIGPLRFDVGYKLRRQSYEKPFAYFVTIGYAF